MSSPEQVIVDAGTIRRMVRRIALAIVEQVQGTERLALVGIRRGGVPLVDRLAREIEAAEGKRVPTGTVDITLYRDDAATALPDPKIGPSEVPFEVGGKDVVLVDDVLMTGRTVRAAIDCLLDYGRPRRVWLAVLLDRGGRELPVAADFIGRTLEVPEGSRVEVLFGEGDDDRAVVVLPEELLEEGT
ncbi:MAG: bifunctional pyr operon transcriptional regulator/uracil phosphoribosyltransferase PyrR [Myxococcota bacterium]